MSFTKSFLGKTKIKPDRWFFYGFLATFTLSIRKIFFSYPLRVEFNEYTSIYFYLTDIFLFLTLIFWLISILGNKYISLSSIKLWISEFFHNLYIFIPFIFVVWSFITIIWSQNQTIAFFRSIKLLELYLLYVYIMKNVPRGTFLRFQYDKCEKCSTWNIFHIIIVLGIVQSIIGIIQFISQKSVGLYLLGESLVRSDIPGVAKIILNGEKYIRAYGLFPHPNILGGFLLFSILLTFLSFKLFHVEQFEIDKSKLTFIKIALIIQALALVLTFSKSAILGLIIASVYIYFKSVVPRGTFLVRQNQDKLSSIFSMSKRMFHVEHSSIIFLTIGVFLLFLAFILKPDLNSIFLQSLKERYFYLNVSREIILNNLVLGIGSGQFVVLLQKYSPIMLLDWQYQPAHNLFLLIWSELGIVGLILFIWLLKKMFHVEHFSISKGNDIVYIYLKATLVGFIFISLFDHYLWDIQQGEILLWIVLGLVASGSYIQSQKKESLLLDK